MNKWEIKNMLEESRIDNTKHTETIAKLAAHIASLWEEIEQKQWRINSLEEKKKDAEDSYRSCMLRERKKRTEEAEYEKKITKELFNKRTDN